MTDLGTFELELPRAPDSGPNPGQILAYTRKTTWNYLGLWIWVVYGCTGPSGLW